MMSQGSVQEGSSDDVVFSLKKSHGSVKGQAQIQITIAGQIQNQWYVDSGATHHVTPETTKVVQGTEYVGPGTPGVDVSQALKQSSGCGSSELQLILEVDKLRQLLVANGNLCQTDTGHIGDDLADSIQEDVLEPAGKGLENGTDAEDVQEQHANEHDGVECTTGAHVEAGADISADVFEPDDHVAGSNEAQGGVLAGLTSGARVEAGAGISIDVLEPAGRGLENGDDAEAVQEQHTNEHNGVECTVGAHVEAGADISADVFEPAGGGLENGVDAEAVQEQHANEQNVDDVELQAESGGCTRVQGCWAVKKVVCEPKVYKKEVWAIETSMLRRLFYINAAKSSSVAHSSSASITSKKKSLVFLGSPQVSATVLDALFNASAAASSFEDDKGDVSAETTGPAPAEVSARTQISAECLAVLLAYP
ncbi:hypothetical protein V6N12_014370 [Hibiscus sabdariffa]|uniref:Uncharacterized protein n=1 Tax=Hibiscus sabdariffa TaxID=183260 RepID=A0ABR2DJY9_9ROSI